MKTKMFKNVVCLCMAATFAISLAIPSFASKETANVSITSGVPGTHPFRYTTNKITTASNQIVLNAYTSGAPVDGTPVTTWKYTGSSTQEWGGLDDIEITAVDAEGRYSGNCISSNANPDVAININRSYSNPEVNTYTIIGNKYLDIAIKRSGDLWYVEPRGNHKVKMYLRTTSSISNSGGGKYMQWNASGTPFYSFDISYNIFT